MEMKRIHENIAEHIINVKDLRREEIELLRSRLSLLSGTDKLLMTMYIRNGNSIRQTEATLSVKTPRHVKVFETL